MCSPFVKRKVQAPHDSMDQGIEAEYKPAIKIGENYHPIIFEFIGKNSRWKFHPVTCEWVNSGYFISQQIKVTAR